MWYKFSQFTTKKGDDWWAVRILNLINPQWRKDPNSYEIFTDVVANLDKYKKQYGPQILKLENLKQNKPKLITPEDSIMPPVEKPRPKYTGPVPPIHDNCRCNIETTPGGRQIWQFADNCCPQCKALADSFNHVQFTNFGI